VAPRARFLGVFLRGRTARRHRDLDAADADAHERTDLEQLETNGAAGGLGELGVCRRAYVRGDQAASTTTTSKRPQSRSGGGGEVAHLCIERIDEGGDQIRRQQTSIWSAIEEALWFSLLNLLHVDSCFSKLYREDSKTNASRLPARGWQIC
jgi:hypothetical protein